MHLNTGLGRGGGGRWLWNEGESVGEERCGDGGVGMEVCEEGEGLGEGEEKWDDNYSHDGLLCEMLLL